MIYMEGEKRLHDLGLHELAGQEIAMVVQYVDAYGGSELRQVVREEWQALSRDHLEAAQTVMNDLVTGSDYLKEFACKLVPHLAEQDPDTGFAHWRRLATSETSEVRTAASEALIESLGRLSLNSQGVAGLVEAIFDAERQYGS